ncbi:hypothetical protein PpBr36_07948 [Pyricularia pennisetigena]|uniref:hypothetical protein n=1 Tax=Pyricularia pennisetigena TaxID=1578925 RepID=UPI0011508ED5|nr:hypothetical protein PpBr36_07948 [Pyricularia pennisetigena]TLS25714.1 hypothetical protein PpBr36_07948 [Pyricularia pennisetigena]
MQTLHIAQFIMLLSIGVLAFPTSDGSATYGHGVDQAKAGASGSFLVHQRPSVAGSGNLEVRSQNKGNRPAWKAEFAEEIRQAQNDQKLYQCPHCKDGISNQISLIVHNEAFHRGAPMYSVKNYYDQRRQ